MLAVPQPVPLPASTISKVIHSSPLPLSIYKLPFISHILLILHYTIPMAHSVSPLSAILSSIHVSQFPIAMEITIQEITSISWSVWKYVFSFAWFWPVCEFALIQRPICEFVGPISVWLVIFPISLVYWTINQLHFAFPSCNKTIWTPFINSLTFTLKFNFSNRSILTIINRKMRAIRPLNFRFTIPEIPLKFSLQNNAIAKLNNLYTFLCFILILLLISLAGLSFLILFLFRLYWVLTIVTVICIFRYIIYFCLSYYDLAHLS